MSTVQSSFNTFLTTKTGLLVRKAVVAFIVTFLAVLIPAGLQILDQIQKGGEPTLTSAPLVALVAGAFGAAVRAVLAILPINLGATDQINTIGSDVETVTVTTKEKK